MSKSVHNKRRRKAGVEGKEGDGKKLCVGLERFGIEMS
jgi:hypothetical protein